MQSNNATGLWLPMFHFLSERTTGFCFYDFIVLVVIPLFTEILYKKEEITEHILFAKASTETLISSNKKSV